MIAAAHTQGQVLAALCPILFVMWLVLLVIGLVGLLFQRPVLLDPVGSVGAAVVLLILWAVLC
jgi:hypothetical protein